MPDGDLITPKAVQSVVEMQVTLNQLPIPPPVVVPFEVNLICVVPFAKNPFGPKVAEGVTSSPLNMMTAPTRNVVPASVTTTCAELVCSVSHTKS